MEGLHLRPAPDSYTDLLCGNSHGHCRDASERGLRLPTPPVGSGFLGRLFQDEAASGQTKMINTLIGCPEGVAAPPPPPPPPPADSRAEQGAARSASGQRRLSPSLPPGNQDVVAGGAVRRAHDTTLVPPIPRLDILAGTTTVPAHLRYTNLVCTRYPLFLGMTALPGVSRSLPDGAAVAPGAAAAAAVAAGTGGLDVCRALPTPQQTPPPPPQEHARVSPRRLQGRRGVRTPASQQQQQPPLPPPPDSPPAWERRL